MSRIGKLPVAIPNGVTVSVSSENEVLVKGPKGELKQVVLNNIAIKIEDNKVILTRENDSRENRALHGLFRSLVANMIEGVSKGFEKTLEIQGVGYKAQLSGKKLILNLGFSHPIEVPAPEGITFKLDEKKKNMIFISGINKQVVGQIAAYIRSLKKPEPYLGKGIRYIGEIIQRKAGKAAGSK